MRAFMQRQRTGSSRDGEGRAPAARFPLQAKLAVSAPGDAHEQEADRVADSVMRGQHLGPAGIGNVTRSAQPKLYRVVANVDEARDSAIPETDTGTARPADEMVQRSAAGAAGPSATGEAGPIGPHFESSLQRAVDRGGQALPASARAFMERRVGWDFSSIRIHSDAESDVLARSVQARAFTVGRDVFFARSEYRPESHEGKRLLAHELVHTMQQSDGRVARQIQRMPCSAYTGYDASQPLAGYNCAGMATRTYRDIAPTTALYDAIAANFTGTMSPVANCGPGSIKFWVWDYDISFVDDRGISQGAAHPDFHTVAGRMTARGTDPTDVYSKNGHRPVYGPGTGPSFRPPVRERATISAPSEAPVDTPDGHPVFKLRNNMTEQISCANCT